MLHSQDTTMSDGHSAIELIFSSICGFQINTIHSQNILIKQGKITEDNTNKQMHLQNTT